MAECSAAQEHRNITTEYQQKELQRVISENCGLQFVEDYYYDGTHHSSVLQKGKTCVILDYDLCSVEENTEKIFDYSKYCEMQNAWMMSSDRLYRFYVTTDRFSACNEQDSGFSSEREDVNTGICAEINRWLGREDTSGEYEMVVVSESTSLRILRAGGLTVGDPVVLVPADTDLADGVYSGVAVKEDLRPISLLLQ